MSSSVCASMQPALARLLGSLLEQCALGVAADEQCRHRKRRSSCAVSRGKRPPGQVAAEDDELRRIDGELGKHGLERDGVAVHVPEDGDAFHPERPQNLRVKATLPCPRSSIVPARA